MIPTNSRTPLTFAERKSETVLRFLPFSSYLILVWLSFLHPVTVDGQEEEPYLFYRSHEFGSEAMYNPVSMIINGGFDILQYNDRSRTLSDIDYATGFHNVMDNLSHPFASINAYGWGNFFREELVPSSLTRTNAQYWPNYQIHLIGGGMSYVHVAEWYRFHGVAGAKLFAIGTLAVLHLLNEVVENNSYSGYNVDPLADLLVFDPLGVALFSISGVPEFFSSTLNMADWSTQPELNPFTGKIENNGQNFSLKYLLPFSDRISLFYYWGVTGLIGFSYHTNDGMNVSFGGGARGKQLVELGSYENGRKVSAELTWNAGIFFDRDNSLIASFLVSGNIDYRYHLNLYPGTLHLGHVSPGFFCGVGEQGKIVMGLDVRYLPFGLAVGKSEF